MLSKGVVRKAMKYALLGRTGLSVSRLSLGAMTFGVGAYTSGMKNNIDQAGADAIVGRAIDAGINLFDTSNVYGQGESEEILGKALGSRRREMVVVTKVGYRMKHRLDNGLSYRNIMQSAEDSLKRLGTDWIDVFLLHRHDALAPYEETARALEQLVQDGKVRYTGLCNHQAWQIERFLGIAREKGWRPMTVAQMYYSLVGRDLEQDCLEFFQDTGLGTMIWSPLAGGFLSGKYKRDIASPDGRWAQFPMPPVDIELGYEVVEMLERMAKPRNATVAQLALAWLLARPWVSTIIVGASRVSQLEQNIGAIDLTLLPEELAELDALTKQKARYPNPRWLPDNAPVEVQRAAVNKPPQ
jgi:aryl-alcohol dehydrogenase-like predicted oxidoreductase